MNRAKISVIFLSLILLGVCAIGATRLISSAEEPAYGGGVYDMLTPELISIYEREIALCPVVSNKSATMLERTAQSLNISTAKLKAIMLLQDLAAKLGEDVSLTRLAEMSDVELFIYAKDRGSAYANALSPERRDELKGMLLSALQA